MSIRREHPTHTTGAHRAHSVRRRTHPQPPDPREAKRAPARGTDPGAGPGTDPGREPGTEGGREPGTEGGQVPGQPAGPGREYRDEHCLDGLFTYCLSVMCEHEAAIAALGEALALAARQRERGRAPAGRAQHRPWLYALTRWACLRRLGAQGGDARRQEEAQGPPLSHAAATQRRRELAALAWPEAAGTTPEQREALELAVRHGLQVRELAAVLSLAPEAAGELLTAAACEVERTRAALAVVESGGCPVVARLAADDRLLLGTALRRELIRHVDDCADCRRAAERAMAGVAWPGTAPTGAAPLAVLPAPRPAVRAAVRAALRARHHHSPRFDRNGFPLDLKDRAARRDRLRSRAVTTTVVATVVAAPILALWAAYRGAPLTGEGHGAAPISATERDEDGAADGDPYDNAGDTGRHPGGDPGRRSGGVSVEVDGAGGKSATQGGSAAGADGLSVAARTAGDETLITLTASGSAPVHWTASTSAYWLSLSRTSGTLQPGESVSVTIRVLARHEPAGSWRARIAIAPAGAVVTLNGYGSSRPGGGPQEPPGSSGPEPSSPEPTSPSPSDSSTSPDPEPTPSDPSSSTDPEPDPTPTPTPSGTVSSTG